MKKCNLRQKVTFMVAGTIGVMSIIVSCHKIGLYKQLPGDPYILVSDAQNTKNKANKVIVKDANDKIAPAYYIEIVSTGTKSTLTPDLVVDTLLVSIPPDLDPMNIKIVPQFLNTSMTAVKIVDTNKIRNFQLQDTAKIQIANGTMHNYTLIDTSGLRITFSNGYQRKYVILAEVLPYVPPRIYDLGSYTGGLDSIDYDDVKQVITIYRSPFNTNLKQILDYKFEPANAIIDPSYQPGAEFDFSSAITNYSTTILGGWYKPVTKTITIPIQVPTKTGGMESLKYTVVLHIGFRKATQLLMRSGTTRDISNFFTASSLSGGDFDEMAIAVNGNYVYVLRLRGATVGLVAAGWATNYIGYRKGDILAYSLKDVTASPIQLSMPTPQGLGKDSFPPICDIMISGNKLIGMGYTQRPSGGVTGNTNIAKVFFVSWDADNPANYTLGDSLDVSLYSSTQGRTPITIIKGNLEGDITKEGAQFYGFHTGAYYNSGSGTRVLYPACKSARLVIDVAGAVRVATKGSGWDTVSYYFNATTSGLTTTGGLSGKVSFSNVPSSEGGGSILSNGMVWMYMKSPLEGTVSTNPLSATNSILQASLNATGNLNSVFANLTGTGSLNKCVDMIYFSYGSMNYVASMDFYNGNSGANDPGISFFALGVNPILQSRGISVPGTTPIGSSANFTLPVLRVAKLAINRNNAFVNSSARGGVAQYRLPNGKLRVAVLAPNSGFGVFDIQ